MFKKGHDPKKIQVTFMKTRQKPIVEKPQNKAGELSPATALMHRGTLGERPVFSSRGKAEGIETKDAGAQGSKGAQNGKTPLGLWQCNERAGDILY